MNCETRVSATTTKIKFNFFPASIKYTTLSIKTDQYASDTKQAQYEESEMHYSQILLFPQSILLILIARKNQNYVPEIKKQPLMLEG